MTHRYTATVEWQAHAGEDFPARRYSRGHRWQFDGGAEVLASSSPQVVPPPMSDAAGVDPEEALVASLASCHMLFFLDFAARAGLDVTSYRDAATGEMGRRDDGVTAMLGVTLHPRVAFAGPADAAALADLHHRAHDACYIANSVNFPVTVEPQS